MHGNAFRFCKQHKSSHILDNSAGLGAVLKFCQASQLSAASKIIKENRKNNQLCPPPTLM